MRAVFTVEIDATGINTYPTDSDFLTRIRAFGWEEMGIKGLPEEERKQKYQERAEELWKEMPEVANEEKPFVIFYGILQDNRTKFVITRMNDSEATFRLLHISLGRLQQSTSKIINSIIKSHANSKGLTISQNRVLIYERGHEEVLITGRVIPNAFKELWVADKKNVLIALVSFLVAVPSFIGLQYFNSSNNLILGGTLERLSTGFLTTIIVSGINLLQTYFQIREEKTIDWKVASVSNPTQIS